MAEYVVMPKADYEAACDSIRAKTGKADKIKSGDLAAEIESITGGGGSSADVRYVTFTNASTGETFVKPVAVGDDCVDVVAKGLWATPTQASTAQYDYAFANSWSAEPNGSSDANILKNITEDKTVYAVFTATLRKYTITWLDEDGTELPGQKQWAYGTTPSYVPLKDGVVFAGWTPTPVAVTGDASYTATWEEGNLVMLDTTSVKTVTQSYTSPYGEAPNTLGVNFVVGETYLVYWNGTEYTLTARTIFFNNSLGGTTLDGIGNPFQVTKIASKSVTGRKIGSSSGETATDTGEPFFITSSTSGFQIRTSSSGITASVRIEKPM